MVVSSIFWDDTGSSGNEVYLSNSTISISYSDLDPNDVSGSGATYTGNINADPVFTGGGDYHLTSSSPCIDEGTASGAPSDDIDDEARPYDDPGKPNSPSAYDMGSDEYMP